MSFFPFSRLKPAGCRLLRLPFQWLRGTAGLTPEHTVFAVDPFSSPASWEEECTCNGQERRRGLRVHLLHAPVQVTDGCFFAPARLENISPSGVCLGNLPEQTCWRSGQLIVYSSTNPAMPVIQVEIVWEQSRQGDRIAGASILNMSRTWLMFFANAMEKAAT